MSRAMFRALPLIGAVALFFAACRLPTATPPAAPTSTVSSGQPDTATPTPAKAITREQAIETAAIILSSSVVARSDIRAELHGWYWEVIFDNLNATADELMPRVLKPPLLRPPGEPTVEPYPGIWQSVVIRVDVQDGGPFTTSARRAPRPGPYLSQSQAIEAAMRSTPPDPSWADRAKVEAYLVGDVWTVAMWEGDRRDHRILAWVDAVTGVAEGAAFL